MQTNYPIELFTGHDMSSPRDPMMCVSKRAHKCATYFKRALGANLDARLNQSVKRAALKVVPPQIPMNTQRLQTNLHTEDINPGSARPKRSHSMRNLITIATLAAMLSTGCGQETSPVPMLGENVQELSMNIRVDGQSRPVRVFHSADTHSDLAASIASAAIADRLAQPTWLEGRFGLQDMLAVINATGPENQAVFVDVCIRADGAHDYSLCSRHSVGEEAESASEIEAETHEAEEHDSDGEDAPKPEPRNDSSRG